MSSNRKMTSLKEVKSLNEKELQTIKGGISEYSVSKDSEKDDPVIIVISQKDDGPKVQ